MGELGALIILVIAVPLWVYLTYKIYCSISGNTISLASDTLGHMWNHYDMLITAGLIAAVVVAIPVAILRYIFDSVIGTIILVVIVGAIAYNLQSGNSSNETSDNGDTNSNIEASGNDDTNSNIEANSNTETSGNIEANGNSEEPKQTATAVAKKFCEQCGAELGEGNVFCGKCGAKVNS